MKVRMKVGRCCCPRQEVGTPVEYLEPIQSQGYVFFDDQHEPGEINLEDTFKTRYGNSHVWPGGTTPRNTDEGTSLIFPTNPQLVTTADQLWLEEFDDQRTRQLLGSTEETYGYVAFNEANAKIRYSLVRSPEFPQPGDDPTTWTLGGSVEVNHLYPPNPVFDDILIPQIDLTPLLLEYRTLGFNPVQGPHIYVQYQYDFPPQAYVDGLGNDDINFARWVFPARGFNFLFIRFE